jgi:hypothetical protein
MRTSALPKRFQELEYDQRVREVVTLGLRARHDKQAAQTIAALADGTADERWLALKSCFGSRDQALILRLCQDPSRAVQRQALKLLARFGDDQAIETCLARLGPKLQSLMLLQLHRFKRFAAIDRFIQSLPEDRQIKLVPLASEKLLAELADSHFPRFSAPEWTKLGRYQPKLACRWLQSQLRQDVSQAEQWLAAINSLLAVCPSEAADAALELVKVATASFALHQLRLDKLIVAKPQALAGLALQQEEKQTPDFSPVIAKLSYKQVEQLEQRGALYGAEYYLQRIPPAWRAKLYHERRHAWRDKEGRLAVGVIKLLPSAERMAEARRNLKLPELGGDHYARIAYAALLPWEEAKQELQSSIQHNEASYRSAALAALIESARYEDRYADLLSLLERHRNEQDPVRLAMLRSLNELPPSRWKSEQLAGLDKLLRAALDAGDLSLQSLEQIQGLLLHLLPFHPQWSIAWLIKLWEERRHALQVDLKTRLNRAQFALLEQAFLPLAQKAKRARDYDHVLNIAYQLESRLEEDSPLIVLLEELLAVKDDQIVRSSLFLLARIAPRRLLAGLPKLVRRDASFITISAVYEPLHRYQQEPLAQALARPAPQGRFNPEAWLIFLPLGKGFMRWSASQQERLADYLKRIISARNANVSQIVKALEQLSELPSIRPDLLIKLASLSEKRAFVRERALRALGRLDNPRAAIAPLIKALGDERARFAIYALRSTLLQLPSSEALEILKRVPIERVSIAKEALRLIGELGTPEAYAYLIATHSQELHRDLRIALLQALWNYLEYDQTWEVFEATAGSEDAVLVKTLCTIPSANASARTQERLLQLTLRLMQHSDPAVRIAAIDSLSQRQLIAKHNELNQALLQASISELPNERRAAISHIFSPHGASDPELMLAVVERLLEHGDYRWLQLISEQIRHFLIGARKTDTSALLKLVERLKTDPYCAPLAIRLAVALQDWDQVYNLLEEFRSRELLYSDLLQSFEQGLRFISQFNQAYQQLETRLASHSDGRFRRLALTLLQEEARQHGWQPSLLKRLQHYRADPDPQVAGPAHFIFPPESAAEADEE